MGWARDSRKRPETVGVRTRGAKGEGQDVGRERRGGKQSLGAGLGEGLEPNTTAGSMGPGRGQPPLTFPGAQGGGPQRGGGAGGGRAPQQTGRGGSNRQQQRKGSGDRRAAPPRRHATAAPHPASGRRRKAWSVAVATRGAAPPPLPWRQARGVWVFFFF